MTAYAYYNEIDPYAADWLRNLIAAGHIMDGEVDSRSIVEVQPDDVRGFTRCHFFAGIGGWDLALQLAGWPADRLAWTGSCPCQPFSVAGKGAGTSDERHLWPHWFRLIRECRPGVVFGEQVEAAIGHGWLDAIQTDLEGESYAVGAVGLPAASVGAPHIRQRLWFVADSHKAGQRLERRSELLDGERPAQRNNTYGCGAPVWLGDADDAGLQGRRERRDSTGERPVGPAGLAGFWADADWIQCRDGKTRPIEPGTFPLVAGLSGRMGRVRADQERLAEISTRKDQGSRVGRLRGYGNAIVPQVAAQVIAAYMECGP